jgi:hypothetical protein
VNFDPSKGEQSFFEAFAWPLPTSFAAAVTASRFELGDVLYREARAYSPWAGVVPKGLQAIQVLDPPRSTRGVAIDGDADRRRANWASAVRIALVDPATGASSERVLTQGQLLTALWRGEESWLDPDQAPPVFPKTARDLHGCLESVPASWRNDRKPKRATGSSVLFVLVVDLASDASRSKSALIGESLRAQGDVDIVDRTPAEVDVVDAELFHPTLVLRGFLAHGRTKESIEQTLRACLYRGGASAPDAESTGDSNADGKDPAPSTDRFSIGRHGLLVEI